MNTRRMVLMLVATGVVFGAVFGMKWVGNFMMVQYLENMPTPPATISATEVQVMRWDNRLEAIGSMVPVNGAELTTEVGGIVEAIHFESGQHVAQGQLLISLSADEQVGELKRLQAQAELTELNRKRREQLYKLEAISKSDYDAAIAEADAAKAAAEAQSGRVAQKKIHAPFAGVLGIRRVNIGQYVSPGMPIVTLQTLAPIDIDFSLPEQYTGQVRSGFTVNVKVDAHPERQFSGEVLAVELRVDEGTRNFGLRGRIANEDGVLRPGQFGRVTLLLPGEREVLVVPRTAIDYSSYGTSVFVVSEIDDQTGKTDQPEEGESDASGEKKASLQVTKRFVQIGDSRGDFVVVSDGVKAGDRVVTSGLMKLRNQQPVIINNDLAPDAKLDPNTPQT